jgi:hypothetical protein
VGQAGARNVDELRLGRGLSSVGKKDVDRSSLGAALGIDRIVGGNERAYSTP